jgi:hydroxymethylbilane synthase
VAVECRSDDTATIDALWSLDDPATRRAVVVERAFLAELGSGCSLPVGVHVDGSSLFAFLAGEDRTRHRTVEVGVPDDVRQAIARARDTARSMQADVA